MSQRYVREVLIAIPVDELADILRQHAGLSPGAMDIEGITLDNRAGGSVLLARVSHLKAPITPVGGVLQVIDMKVLEEDYR